MDRHGRGQDDRTAASWFVEVLDQPADPAAEERFVAWLDSDAGHQDELARCEASVHLARELASEGELRWAFAEAAELAHPRTRHRLPAWGRRWFRNPAIAWTVAALSTAAAVLPLVDDAYAPAESPAVAIDPVPALPPLPLASTDPVVELPGHIIVDAHSVAVLPFTSSGGDRSPNAKTERLTTSMHDGLVDTLSTIPGLYVIGRESVQPYDGSGMQLEEIAAQLGVRGIVQANITPAGDRVRIVLRLTDAATDELLFQSVYERPLERLNTMDAEMAHTIALALARPAQPVQPQSTQEGEIT